MKLSIGMEKQMKNCEHICENCEILECLYRNLSYNNMEEFEENMINCFGKHIISSDELENNKKLYNDYDDVMEFFNDKYFKIEENIEIDGTCKSIIKERIEEIQKLIRNMKILGI